MSDWKLEYDPTKNVLRQYKEITAAEADALIDRLQNKIIDCDIMITGQQSIKANHEALVSELQIERGKMQ